MSRSTPAKELLSLTHAMVAAAEGGDWGEVEKIETRRQHVLKDLGVMNGGSVDLTTATDMSNQISEVLVLNKRIMALCLRARSEMADAISGLNRSRKAIHAYHGIG